MFLPVAPWRNGCLLSRPSCSTTSLAFVLLVFAFLLGALAGLAGSRRPWLQSMFIRVLLVSWVLFFGARGL